MIGTTIDYGKSNARRCLRGAGVDAGNAQDIVDAVEIATVVVPIAQSAKAGKIFSKTGQSIRNVAQEVSAASKFGLSVIEYYARLQAHGPQLVYARSKTFDRTFTAPKRSHSSILFQERSSRFDSQRVSQLSKAPAAKVAQKPDLKIVSDGAPVDFPQQTVREKLFGTNDVKEFSNQRVRPINDRMPINSDYAGKSFRFDKINLEKKLEKIKDPVKIERTTQLFKDLNKKYPHGVPFSGAGQVDFSRYSQKNVRIDFSGNRKTDEVLANKVAGYPKTPEGFTWHHHHDCTTMQLLPTDLHDTIKHIGGFAIMKGN